MRNACSLFILLFQYQKIRKATGDIFHFSLFILIVGMTIYVKSREKINVTDIFHNIIKSGN